MAKFHQLPKSLFRLLKYPPQIVYALGLGSLMGKLVLLLTTTGRKTRLRRVTPLQYEEDGDVIYLGASRGLQSDWVRNILADPQVEVQVKARRFRGTAEVITELPRIVDFLELRLRKHPRMVAAMLKTDGIPQNPSRAQLETYAQQIVVVAVRPNP
jgi:deazaflavin-dependent oxidoreductase (nitroreductase family)